MTESKPGSGPPGGRPEHTPQSEWKWFGHAGHFICAEWCRFHLCTLIGPWLVSTVGEYLPDESTREILATSRGIALAGKGDARRFDFIKRMGFEEIGYGRKFETMVFRAGAICERPGCDCGLPEIGGNELDFDGYNDPGAATQGHMALCAKWSLLDKEPADDVGGEP